MTFLSGKQKKFRKFFSEEDNMMYENSPWWIPLEESTEDEWGDALWRTSLAYIAYPQEEKILKGILSCFHEKEGYIQASRTPNKGFENVSRDQIIMALCALKINGQTEELKRISKNLRYRISDKYTMSLGMFLWVKWLASNNNFFLRNISFFVLLFQHFFTFITAKPLMLFWGYKKTNQEDLKLSPLQRRHWKHKYHSMIVPSYAIHLSAWQAYTYPKKWQKKLLGVFLISLADKTNYLIQILLQKKKIDIKGVKSYKPMNDFRFQRNIDDQLWGGSPFIIKESEAEFNALDIDVLKKVIFLEQRYLS